MKQFPTIPPGIRSNAGYTIIEALIAIAIFSIGIMAMGALQAASLRTTGNIGRLTEVWAVLEDHAETLKAMPFYANDDGINNDGDGQTDELTEEMPELIAGNYNAPRAGGRYTVHWQVVDNAPIPAVVVPPPTAADPVLATADGTGLPNGTYTVSKTVSVQVTRAGGNPVTDALATVQFVKTWAAQGIGVP